MSGRGQVLQSADSRRYWCPIHGAYAQFLDNNGGRLLVAFTTGLRQNETETTQLCAVCMVGYGGMISCPHGYGMVPVQREKVI